MTLGLRISLSEKPGIFPGGADLYGSAAFPGTLVNLAPGDSIRVLTRVALPEGGDAAPGAETFDASASLVNQTLKTVNGQIVSDSQELDLRGARVHAAVSPQIAEVNSICLLAGWARGDFSRIEITCWVAGPPLRRLAHLYAFC